mmetsp:Transcript_74725/g.241617  ORF Transcript_74725/g.241617 Transcript_74725/m.241617 type:complete len:330 (-) Transcript_74725:1028-2017(-)
MLFTPGLSSTWLVLKKKGTPSRSALRRSKKTATSQLKRIPEMTRPSPGSKGAKCTWFRAFMPPPGMRPFCRMLATCRWYVPCTQTWGRSLSPTWRRRRRLSSETTFMEWPWEARTSSSPPSSRRSKRFLSLERTASCMSATVQSRACKSLTFKSSSTRQKPSGRIRSPRLAPVCRNTVDMALEMRTSRGIPPRPRPRPGGQLWPRPPRPRPLGRALACASEKPASCNGHGADFAGTDEARALSSNPTGRAGCFCAISAPLSAELLRMKDETHVSGRCTMPCCPGGANGAAVACSCPAAAGTVPGTEGEMGATCACVAEANGGTEMGGIS